MSWKSIDPPRFHLVCKNGISWRPGKSTRPSVSPRNVASRVGSTLTGRYQETLAPRMWATLASESLSIGTEIRGLACRLGACVINLALKTRGKWMNILCDRYRGPCFNQVALQIYRKICTYSKLWKLKMEFRIVENFTLYFWNADMLICCYSRCASRADMLSCE